MLLPLNFTRLKTILGNAFSLFLPSIANMLLSVLVIYKTDSQLWGQVVIYQIYYYFITAVVSWGNKEDLLLKFSKNPAKITALWQQSLVSRFWFLLLPSLAFTVVYFPWYVAINVVCWIAFRFIGQSFECIWVFNKTYKLSIISELLALLPVFLLLINVFETTENNILFVLTTMFLIKTIVVTFSNQSVFKNIELFKANTGLIKQSFSFMLLSFVGFLQIKSDLYCIGYFSEKEVIGKYQILTSIANLIYLVPGFLMVPFTKHIYRLNKKSLRSLELKLIVQGLFFCILHSILLVFIMRFLYTLTFDYITYFLLFIGMVLPFLNIIPIYKIYKHNGQKYVFAVSFIGIVINVLCCVFFIPVWQINGAIVANLCSLLFLFFAFRINLGSLKQVWRMQNAIRFYKKIIPPNALCFDGGANIGKRSKILLKCGFKVIAIEPQRACLPKLELLKAKSNNFYIVPTALSNKSGALTMFISNVSEVSTFSQEFMDAYKNETSIQWNDREQVTATTLDELIKEYGAPYFCKLDLENYELQALQGLTAPISLISFEFNKPLINNAITCAAYLSKLGDYEFNMMYYERFVFANSKWVNFDELQIICGSMPESILTGEIFARLK